MSPAFLRLAAHLLDRASDEFSNHGCNDLDFPEEFTPADLEALTDAYNIYNLGPDRNRWAPDQILLSGELGDFCAMSLLANELRKLADEVEGRK